MRSKRDVLDQLKRDELLVREQKAEAANLYAAIAINLKDLGRGA